MKRKLFLPMVLFLWFPGAVHATHVELVCPCLVEANGMTSVSIRAGLINRGSEETGPLRLSLWQHEEPTIFDGIFYDLAFHELPDTLEADEVVASQTYTTGLYISELEGSANLTLVLEEETSEGNWGRADHIRLRDSVILSPVGGYALGSAEDDEHAAVFFDGDPQITLDGSEVTINLPKIVNNSPTWELDAVSVDIIQTPIEDFFSSTYFESTPEITVVSGLSPKSQTPAQQVSASFSDHADHDWYHLRLREGSNTVAFQTVRVRGGELPNRELDTGGIEMLEDTDGDGVSNYNERLEGTDAEDINDVPPSSQIDVLAIYTPRVSDFYPAAGELEARLDQIETVTRQIFSDSGTDIDISFVEREMIDVDDTLDSSEVLDLMEAGALGSGPDAAGAFDGLDLRKASTGADAVVTFLYDPDADLCGRATLTGESYEGDFASSGYEANAVAVVYVDCRDSVTSHELGHVLGLDHARRQDTPGAPPGGTFVWSAGYGVDGLASVDDSFVTVMAYASAFTDAEEVEEIDLFSDPTETCKGVPCGVDITDYDNGAFSVRSLQTTRFQVAAFTTYTDSDGDGTVDYVDTDDDNDGVPDVSDEFPLDETEFVDTDGDGLGDNADTDDDNDGVPDISDEFPLDETEFVDTDGDGLGDNADTDDDGDGVPDDEDPEPLNASVTGEESSTQTDPSQNQSATTPTSSNGGVGGGGGGGCSYVSTTSSLFDPSLPVLVFLSLGYLLSKRQEGAC